MVTWPVPDSPAKTLPEKGEPGSFWEDRGDRRHCGIDICAPVGSLVVAIADGNVIETGVQTDPAWVPYWNRTCFVLVDHPGSCIARYAELADTTVRAGDTVREGECLGHIGTVIHPGRVTRTAPAYVRELVRSACTAMLHLECYRSLPVLPEDRYRGGNWFGPKPPAALCDPGTILQGSR
jgi:murein DD-endopeptidase MepM/ murein hydrolase activator NlpD